MRTFIRKPLAILAFLTGLNILNYLVRFIIASVGPSMQKELGLSDGAFGAIGAASLWGYVLVSPFVGRFASRWPRLSILAGGLALWSVATFATGALPIFVVIIGVQFLVGIGQALFTALSPTLLDDLSTARQKNRILSVFYSAIPIGSALGFIYGGLMDRYFGWHAAFMAAGVFGLACAPFILAVHDPVPGLKKAGSWLKEVVSLWKSRRYVWAVVGYAAQTFALGGFAFWAPSFLERRFNYPIAQGNLIFGGIVVVTGFIGSLAGGWIGDHWPGNDRLKAALQTSTVLTLIGIPFGFLAVLTTSPMVFFAAMAAVQLAIFGTFAPINAVFLGSVPNAIRGTAIGFSIFAGRLLGDMVSIWLVGALSDVWHSLPSAMLILPVALVANVILWWVGSHAKKPSAI